jgi:hypothetical protein
LKAESRLEITGPFDKTAAVLYIAGSDGSFPA